MQAQHLIIMTILLPVSWIILGYFVWRATMRIERRYASAARLKLAVHHADKAQILHDEIDRLLQMKADLELKLKDQIFTRADRVGLIAASHTLELAARTWKGLRALTKAEEATAQHRLLNQFASRIRGELATDIPLPGQSLDTQLLEWLNERGDFWGEPQATMVRFPHQTTTPDFAHLREAVSDAYEQDMKRQAIEMGLAPEESAA